MEKRRIEWLDIAKGIGIILVFLGHAPRDIMREEYFGIDFIYQFIYSFHMQMFFIISGLLFAIYLNKDSAGVFVKKKAKTLLLPWIIYTVLIYLVRFCAEFVPQISAMLSGGDLAMIPFKDYVLLSLKCDNPYSFHLWFIFILFFVQIASFFVCKLLGKLAKDNKNAIAISLLAVSVVVFFATRGFEISAVQFFGVELFSFAVGACFGIFDIQKMLRNKPASIGISLLGITYIIAYSAVRNAVASASLAYVLRYILVLVGAPCMAYFVFFICSKIQGGFAKPLKFMGKNSFSFYLLHQPFSCALVGAVLIKLVPASIISYIAIMAMCFALCFIFPFVVVRLMYKLHLEFLLKPLNIQNM